MENASKALIIAGAILIAILLITIGIVLINSGRDIVETGVTAMQSQAIQIFNSKFTPYEGIISGIQLKNLINLVQQNNATNEEHPIFMIGSFSKNNIKETEKYNVTLLYNLGKAPFDPFTFGYTYNLPWVGNQVEMRSFYRSAWRKKSKRIYCMY